ncbi:type II secretion system F family protein [Natranaerobius thermophilus]|uniref:Type II secretion system protein n=1 Tax=Natranaerobius thermophilus (strain ATCC BAA-1301 / DSM 18059 / JW/NM-WN-LF) TaxID=457570 RepID=B2A8J6_NATTJ|nr:type II secretion system F family protein [Natranaerobius thermophilus]ACB85880.1 type II secretion system protein [Natranaerobius thermophilus JW/NM-WN-LF]
MPGTLMLYLTITACMTGIFLNMYQFLFRKRIETKNRLSKLNELTDGSAGSGFEHTPRTPLQKALALPVHRRVVLPLFHKLTAFLEKLLPHKVFTGFKKDIISAGLSQHLNATELLAAYFLIICLGLVMAVFFVTFLSTPVWTGMVLVILGFIGPKLWLSSKVNTRKNEIQRALPEFLDLLTVSVEAGLGFESSLKKVAEEGTGPLAVEIKRVTQEISMGKSRKEALIDLKERIDLQDLSTFINAIIQAEQLGVGISRVLKVESKEFRRKRRQRAEEQAMKAPVKLLIPLILFIFPTIFIILLGPAALRIMDNLIGTF